MTEVEGGIASCRDFRIDEYREQCLSKVMDQYATFHATCLLPQLEGEPGAQLLAIAGTQGIRVHSLKGLVERKALGSDAAAAWSAPLPFPTAGPVTALGGSRTAPGASSCPRPLLAAGGLGGGWAVWEAGKAANALPRQILSHAALEVGATQAVRTQAITRIELVDSGLYTTTRGGGLQKWDLGNGGAQCVASIQAHSAAVNDLSVSADQGTAATASDDGTVRLWDLRAPKCRETIGSDGVGPPVTAAQVDEGGSWVVTGSADAQLGMWSVHANAWGSKATLEWAPRCIALETELVMVGGPSDRLLLYSLLGERVELTPGGTGLRVRPSKVLSMWRDAGTGITSVVGTSPGMDLISREGQSLMAS